MTTAMTKFEDRFPVLYDMADMMLAVQENLGGDEMGVFELPRAKIPAGGGPAWNVDRFGDEDAQKTITGVILMHRLTRSLFLTPMGDGEPPTCFSDDGLMGSGEPGGVCRDCRLNQFKTASPGGSGTEQQWAEWAEWAMDQPDAIPILGAGKACSEKRQVFVLPEGDMMPMLISLPASSLRPMMTYLRQLAFVHKLPASHVVTSFALATRQMNGNNVSVVKPSVASKLDAEQVAVVSEYKAGVMDVIVNVVRNEAAGAGESA